MRGSNEEREACVRGAKYGSRLHPDRETAVFYRPSTGGWGWIHSDHLQAYPDAEAITRYVNGKVVRNAR